jgi:hypothetical protein
VAAEFQALWIAAQRAFGVFAEGGQPENGVPRLDEAHDTRFRYFFPAAASLLATSVQFTTFQNALMNSGRRF